MQKIFLLGKYLILWIFLAIVLRDAFGYFFSGIIDLFDKLSFGTTYILLALGLILLIIPPLSKVDYSQLIKAFRDKKEMTLSLFLDRIAATILIFLLVIVVLSDQPDFMVGLILFGFARCIAKVIIWTDLAGSKRNYSSLLMALNSVFQVVNYFFYAWLFINVLPHQLGLGNLNTKVPMGEFEQSAAIYLGIPLLAGFLSRKSVLNSEGIIWYNTKFIPKISTIILYTLLFTTALMFSLKGDKILELPLDVLKVAISLVVYFVMMFFVIFFINKSFKVTYDKKASIAFTSKGKKFEIAISAAVTFFSIYSTQAFEGKIGPFVEVPVLKFV